VGCAYDDYIAGHNRRRVESDFAGERIDLLVVILLQVHSAICAKAANRGAGLRVQSDEPVARRHIQDSFLPPITPISQPAAGELARRDRSSAAFTLSMRPYQFARPRIDGDDSTACSGCRIQNTVNHERRRFQVEFRLRTQIIRFESPGDLETVEV